MDKDIPAAHYDYFSGWWSNGFVSPSTGAVSPWIFCRTEMNDEWFSLNHKRQELILTNWTWKPPPRLGGQPTCCLLCVLVGERKKISFCIFFFGVESPRPFDRVCMCKFHTIIWHCTIYGIVDTVFISRDIWPWSHYWNRIQVPPMNELNSVDSSSSSEVTASEDENTWISWYIGLRGNDYFCEGCFI